MKKKVFLCHASEDKDLAERIQHALTNAGYTVFFDTPSLSPGSDYHADIEQAIAQCDIFIFLISKYSVAQNKYTRNELDFVRKTWPRPAGRVLPVNIGNLQKELIPPYLTSITIPEINGNVPSQVRSAVESMMEALIKKKRKRSAIIISLALVILFAFFSLTDLFSPLFDSSLGGGGSVTLVDGQGEGESYPIYIEDEVSKPVQVPVQVPEMVHIEGGCYFMGNSTGQNLYDETPHKVCVGDFWMSRYEIVFSEYAEFLADSGHAPPNDPRPELDKQPVINVSWQEATDYSEWLSKKTSRDFCLPTEAQWEYAARAGTKTPYYWGIEPDKKFANYGKRRDPKIPGTSPVGGYRENKLGLYDMLGNVWEWTCSQFSPDYNGSDDCAANPHTPVMRGGSWQSSQENLRVARRLPKKKTYKANNVGFRLAEGEACR